MMSDRFGYSCFGRFDIHLRNGNEHIFDEHAQGFLDAVRETASEFDRELDAGTPVFRAQHGCDMTPPERVLVECYERSRMLPNHLVGAGRANKAGKPMFYAATTPKLAVQETRPWIGQYVSLAEFHLEKPRRILDLTLPKHVPLANILHKAFGKNRKTADPRDTQDAAWSDIAEAFATPVSNQDTSRDYLTTQVLAELFRTIGYDGIAFRSSLTQRDADLRQTGFNVILFDFDDLVQKSGEVIKIKQLNIEYEQTIA